MEWIKKVAPVAGYIIGLILVAIGAVMTLQSGMKLAFAEPDSYYYENLCEDNARYGGVLAEEGMKEVVMTPEEKESCLQKQEEREMKQFKNRHVQDLINGFSLLIVGGIFWGLFRERKEK